MYYRSLTGNQLYYINYIITFNTLIAKIHDTNIYLKLGTHSVFLFCITPRGYIKQVVLYTPLITL